MHFNEFELNLSERSKIGTSAARNLRLENKAPVSVYGKGIEPKAACVEISALKKAVASKSLFNKFTYLNLGSEKLIAFAKVVQLHPVTDEILHIDFQAIKKGEVAQMRIPVRFKNAELCEAIKLGGMLNIVCSYIELTGKVDDMPEYLECDLKNAKVGISLKMDSLNIPNGLKPLKKYEDKVVATILAARKKGASEEADAAAATTNEAA